MEQKIANLNIMFTSNFLFCPPNATVALPYPRITSTDRIFLLPLPIFPVII